MFYNTTIKYKKTRNVSIGHGCPHLCNCGRTDGRTEGRTDGRTDKGKSKCPLKWEHKNCCIQLYIIRNVNSKINMS